MDLHLAKDILESLNCQFLAVKYDFIWFNDLLTKSTLMVRRHANEVEIRNRIYRSRQEFVQQDYN